MEMKKLSESGSGEMEGGGGPDTASPQSHLQRNAPSRGSFRKVLPSLPDMDQQLSMATRMIDRRTSSKKGNHSYTPYFLEYTLLAEYNLLQKQNVSGVYVIPSANSPLIWFGIIFIRRGIYAGGIFRFRVHIPENFPDGEVPSVIFETTVFHPLIDPQTGELEVKKGFANTWRRNVHHLWHVLLYLRRVFYKIEPTHPPHLNPEAAILFESNLNIFESRVEKCVAESREKSLDPPLSDDPHAITFSPYDPLLHDKVKQEMKSEHKSFALPEPNAEGVSWVAPGSLNVFSKKGS